MNKFIYKLNIFSEDKEKLQEFLKKFYTDDQSINKSKYCSFQHIEEIMSQGYLDRFIIDSLKTLYKENQKEKKYEYR